MAYTPSMTSDEYLEFLRTLSPEERDQLSADARQTLRSYLSLKESTRSDDAQAESEDRKHLRSLR